MQFQVGIQFIQIGNDSSRKMFEYVHVPWCRGAADAAQDIVDTTPYAKLHPITGAGLIKALLGGIDRRIDAQS